MDGPRMSCGNRFQAAKRSQPRRFGAPILAAALLVSAYAPVASAQSLAAKPVLDPVALASLCASESCRRNVSIRMDLGNGQAHEERLDLYRPPIGEDSLSILIGEEVRAVPEFARRNFERWREPRRREMDHTPVLTFGLQQRNDGTMAAALSNSGQAAVKIDLYLRTPGSTQYHYQPTCPIPAGQTLFEYWNDPVMELQVRSATVLPRSATLDRHCD